MHSLESLLPEQCAKEFMEMEEDETQKAESNCLEPPPYEDSEGFEESIDAELVRVNIDCKAFLINGFELGRYHTRILNNHDTP